MVITRVKNRSPDMILTAFDGKFHEKKDEIPPRACRPPKKFPKILKKCTWKWGSRGRQPERGVRGAAAPREGKKGGPGGSAPRVSSWFLG